MAGLGDDKDEGWREAAVAANGFGGPEQQPGWMISGGMALFRVSHESLQVAWRASLPQQVHRAMGSLPPCLVTCIEDGGSQHDLSWHRVLPVAGAF